jgi:hypothetical protein
MQASYTSMKADQRALQAAKKRGKRQAPERQGVQV